MSPTLRLGSLGFFCPRPFGFLLSAGLLAAGAYPHFSVAAEANPSQVTEVIVTGSLLPSERDIAVPVTQWSAEDLAVGAEGLRLSSFLQMLNQSGRATNALATGGASTLNGGLSTADLRGLGPNRTLVLVNGKRLVGGDPLSPTATDLNTIPMDWVERVEVYSGGATAIYGSGAVAGVINVITRPAFEGVQIKARYGLSAEGDGRETGASFSAGSRFAEDRGHVALNFSWDDNQPIWSRDREFSADVERLGDRKAYSQYTPTGVIVAADNQALVPDSTGSWTENFNLLQHGYNQAQARQLYVPLERTQGQIVGSFQISDRTRFYAQLGGGMHESSNQQEAVTVLNNPNTSLPSSYPFFPQEILDTWTDAGQPLPQQIRYARRLNEMGPRIYRQERENWRLLTGLEFRLGEWSGDVSYQESRNEFSQVSSGYHQLQRMSWALNVEEDPDAPGTYRCVSEVARAQGCVPVDLFSSGGIAPAALQFVQAEQTYDAQLAMRELQWRMQGPLMRLPAGDVNAVFGVDWRKESLESDVDELTKAGLISSVALSAVRGRDEVREAYAELFVPLLREQWVEALDMSLAYRLSDYDSIGSAQSWNAALSFSPVQRFNLFARRSLAIRAPSITEFFLPATGGSRPISDPCAASAVVSEQARDNCRSLGIPEDYAPTPQELTVPYRIAGNPDLEEEKARTTTLGLSYSPWDGLQLRASWFDVDIGNAIVNIDPNFKLNRCYSSAEFPDHPLCRGLNRGGSENNFRLLDLELGPENIGMLRTRGVDAEVDATLTLGDASLHNRLMITYTDRLLQEANGQFIDRINEPGAQRWKASYLLAYTRGPWQTAVTARYLGSAVIENNSVEAYIRDNNNLPSVTYWGAHLAYAWDFTGRGGDNTRLSLHIHNLTDKQPPYVPSPSRSASTGTGTAAGVYDVRGRFWQLAIEHRF